MRRTAKAVIWFRHGSVGHLKNRVQIEVLGEEAIVLIEHRRKA